MSGLFMVVYGCLGQSLQSKGTQMGSSSLGTQQWYTNACNAYPLMHVTDAQKYEVIDSSDRDRIDEAHEELMKMLQKDEMKDWRYLGCVGETAI